MNLQPTKVEGSLVAFGCALKKVGRCTNCVPKCFISIVAKLVLNYKKRVVMAKEITVNGRKLLKTLQKEFPGKYTYLF